MEVQAGTRRRVQAGDQPPLQDHRGVRPPPIVTLVAVLAMMAAVVIGAATITRTPPVYGDEPWIASEVNSLVHGGGLRPEIYSGSGLWDRAQNVTDPYLGMAPFMLTALLVKPSLLAYRLTAFLIGLGALGVFALAFRRFGLAIAAAATAALATSWGFIAASHYVRWDSLAFLVVAAVLALLWRGPPGKRLAVGLGILLGASLDVQGSLVALVPGAAVLLAWQHEDRWRRVALFGGGLALGSLAFLAAHYLSEPSEAQRQWNLLLAPAHYKPPLLRAVEAGRPGLLYAHESERYHEMTLGLSLRQYAEYGSLMTLGLGVAASALALAELRARAARVTYPFVAVPGILFLGYVFCLPLIQGNKAAQMYAWYSLPLSVAAIAALATVGRAPTAFSRGWRAAVVFAGTLAAVVGLTAAVISVLPSRVVSHHLVYEWYALPFAAAALATVAARMPRVNGGEWAVLPLLALAIAGGGYLLSDVRKTTQPVTNSTVDAAFHRYVPPSVTVLAEPIFWWVDPSPGFRSNATIWLSEFVRHWSFTTAVHRICPRVIVVDDMWLNRYLVKTDFPNLAPTNPAERGTLEGLLRREYVLTGRVTAAGDRLAFWRRAATLRPCAAHTAS